MTTVRSCARGMTGRDCKGLRTKECSTSEPLSRKQREAYAISSVGNEDFKGGNNSSPLRRH